MSIIQNSEENSYVIRSGDLLCGSIAWKTLLNEDLRIAGNVCWHFHCLVPRWSFYPYSTIKQNEIDCIYLWNYLLLLVLSFRLWLGRKESLHSTEGGGNHVVMYGMEHVQCNHTCGNDSVHTTTHISGHMQVWPYITHHLIPQYT